MSGVRVDAAALQAYLTSPNGDIARDIIRRTRNVQLKAKELVPKRTRELERNIITRYQPTPRGFVGRVIAGEQLPDARAVWAELGTRPHLIVPRNPGGTLSFLVQQKRVFARKVHHPGQAAQHYMLRALEEARR